MERFETVLENGTLYVEATWGLLEVGTLEELYELVGGETYTIEYEDDYSRAVDWLDLDDDGVMTIGVRETLETMTFPATFVETLATRSMSIAEDGEYPERTVYFAEIMTTVWDEKGNLGDESDNPFR